MSVKESEFMYEAACSGLRYTTPEACGDVSAVFIDGKRWPVVMPHNMRRIDPTTQPTATSCFRACVAAVLKIPVENVTRWADGDCWDWDQFQAWLAEHHAMQAIEVSLSRGAVVYPMPQTMPCIITGKSPRPCPSGRHAVVAVTRGLDGFEIIHDPHPDGYGIDGEPTHVVFFALIDPSLHTL